MDINYRVKGSQTGTWKIWTRQGSAIGFFYIYSGYVRFKVQSNHTGISELHHVLCQMRLPNDPGYSADMVVAEWDGLSLTHRADLALT